MMKRKALPKSIRNNEEVIDMKIIHTENRYNIFEGSMTITDKLEAKVYSTRFDPDTGLYLENYGDISINEKKIYGQHYEKLEKIFSAFERFNRNFGVLLSGAKGMGKTLFIKMTALEALKRGIPVIVVDKYYDGISTFLRKIDQEVLILFDEFEKRFGEDHNTCGIDDGMGIGYGINRSPVSGMMFSHQTELLELFDGISSGKKMFVLTCNEISTINNYLIDRPGRIHYHLRFTYPTPKEIMQYSRDNIDPKYQDQCRILLNYSFMTKISYDALRAIIFEVNSGISVEEAIKDLNISRDVRSSPEFAVSLHFRNKSSSAPQINMLNFFSEDFASVEIKYRKRKMKQRMITIDFQLKNLVFDEHSFQFRLPADKIHSAYCDPMSDEEYFDAEELFEKDGLDYILFEKSYR